MNRFWLLLSLPILLCFSCHNNDDVPVLSPKKSMKQMKLEDPNLEVRLVASEPLVRTPVAMNIDDKGRLWVVEMADYKPIKTDSSQQYPTGKIVILEDTDGDGIMDKRKIFLDSIASPRALCLVDKGILVSEPPNLWYYEIENDRPGKRALVDSAYTVSGNIEGQTNGLLRAMDNWIYSAGFGSSKRYRRKNGVWLTEKTFLRGQWGIAQDDYGRLFYNNNSQNLLADYFPPNVTSGNKYLRKTAGFNQRIVPDNRTYPLIATPGVNRGYREGELDSTGRLVHLTAACGPLIYRGNLLPNQYYANAFVAEPAAYLIKRNILNNRGIEVAGKQAWEGKEFLASSDERFRPVSLYDGPDGALYIVDMYRGVIQDDLSLTDYLKEYSLEKGLEKPINTGRIYKVVPKDTKYRRITIPDEADQLPELFHSKNGWLRDRAQQRIVDHQYKELVPELKKMLADDQDDLAKIHVLWTLEGLDALSKEDVINTYERGDTHLKQEVLTVLKSVLSEENIPDYLPFLQAAIQHSDTLSAPFITFTIGTIYGLRAKVGGDLFNKILKLYTDDPYVVDAIISNIQGKEELFRQKFVYSNLFSKRLEEALEAKDHPEDKRKMAEVKKKYEQGYAIFESFCQTCHGADGNGIPYLAPPLNGSEWVNGDKQHLIPILLYGLTGPIEVKGKMYRKPAITGDMPGIGEKYNDEDIVELINFIRHAWNNSGSEITQKDIDAVRKKYGNRTQSVTVEELKGE